MGSATFSLNQEINIAPYTFRKLHLQLRTSPNYRVIPSCPGFCPGTTRLPLLPPHPSKGVCVSQIPIFLGPNQYIRWALHLQTLTMPKGSGNRIIPSLWGSGLWRQYFGWKGTTINLNMTQENPNTVHPWGSSRPLGQGPPTLGHQLSPRKLY